MKITVPLQNGFLEDKYDQHATAEQKINNVPCISFPIDIKNVPEGTKTLALALIDIDSIPVRGFPWIHWVAANIPGDIRHLPANNSQAQIIKMTNGKNTGASEFYGPMPPILSQRYVGPMPPNGQSHSNILSVWALDTELPLQDGFWFNEMLHEMHGHVLDCAKFNVLAIP